MKSLLICVPLIVGCGGATRSARAPGSPAADATAPAVSEMRAPPAAKGDRALLVVGGFGAARDEITSAELQRDYCSGAIGVVEQVRPAADAHFKCTNKLTVASLRDAVARVREDKTRLFVADLDHVTSQWKAMKVDGVSFFEKPNAYALVLDGPGGRPDFAPQLTHFIMTGVTAITRATGAACEKQGIEWLTRNLRPAFEGAHYVHISNEVSFKADCTYPTSHTYQFCTKEADMKALLDLKANVIELTGNHNRDFGDEAFVKTLDWYKKHDMKTFGGGASPEAANEPIVLELAGGKRLGILGFNEACPLKECAKKPGEVGANAYDAEKAEKGIARLRDELAADYVMVTVQFREHDFPQPTKAQASISKELIDMGADLVYGSQAHQLQVIEFYKGKPIFHGLGNLLFDQIHRIGVRQAYFLHHYFFEGRLVQSVPVFTYMSDERQPTLATPEQAAAMKAIVFQDELLYR